MQNAFAGGFYAKKSNILYKKIKKNNNFKYFHLQNTTKHLKFRKL